MQLTEQELVQVTVQLEPAAHETLPLSPKVTLQDEFALQLTLQLLPHEPVQVACSAQSSEQLGEVPHELEVMSHWAPEAHMQLVPVQVGGVLVPPPELPLLPQADAKNAKNVKARDDVSGWDMNSPCFVSAARTQIPGASNGFAEGGCTLCAEVG